MKMRINEYKKGNHERVGDMKLQDVVILSF